MGKSTRSKVKRSYRAKKRQEGIFAATDAARLHRLSSKLKSVTAAKNVVENEEEMLAEGGDAQAEGADGQASSGNIIDGADAMDLDSGAGPSNSKISTHGPRGSRREEWRLSKGMSARAQSKGMNRQGLVAGRRKSGRSHRRR